MSAPTFASVLKALQVRGVGLTPGGAPWAFGGPDGELREEAWAICPGCGFYGFKATRLPDGLARVSCRGACRSEAIYAALAEAVIAETVT